MSLFTFILQAQNSEERYFKDKSHIPQGFGIHSDVGYSTYQVEIDSSELHSAIDYDVIELTMGLSYVYGRWMWGLYSKLLLDELKSNIYLPQKSFDNQALIDKKESVLYLNYRIFEEENQSWRLNLLYRESRLNAKESLSTFYAYRSHFNYQTKGVALSLVYGQKISEESSYFFNIGVLSTQAKLEINEQIENKPQDVYIDDKSHAFGFKLTAGYNHQLSSQWILNLRADVWRLNFNRLDVASLVGDQLPKASLKEESFSSYLGLTWRF